ncbi:LOW QUALITY PROTEIN: coiled-coil domain-containing protein 158 [Rhynochetos jubatus]
MRYNCREVAQQVRRHRNLLHCEKTCCVGRNQLHVVTVILFDRFLWVRLTLQLQFCFSKVAFVTQCSWILSCVQSCLFSKCFYVLFCREALERQTKKALKLYKETTKFPVESMISLSHEESLPSDKIPSVGKCCYPISQQPECFSFCILSTVMENSSSSEKNVSGAGKEYMENILEEYSQKGRDVQKRLNETTQLHEQQKIDLQLITADLQSKLMEVQLERDVLQDTSYEGQDRCTMESVHTHKESQSQENVKMQLKNTIQELEAANQLNEEMLKEADSQTEHLKKLVHSDKEVLSELCGILMDYEDSTGKKLYEHENASLHIHNLSTAFADIQNIFENSTSIHLNWPKEMVVAERGANAALQLRWQVPVEEELESLKKDSQTQNQLFLQQHQSKVPVLHLFIYEKQIEVFPCSIDNSSLSMMVLGIKQLLREQEVAALTDKADSACSCANSIQSQVKITQLFVSGVNQSLRKLWKEEKKKRKTNIKPCCIEERQNSHVLGQKSKTNKVSGSSDWKFKQYKINFQQRYWLNHKQERVVCIKFLISQPKTFLREQRRTQNSVHAHQVSHLESTVSLGFELQEAKRTYEDKVKDLERQLDLAHSEMAEAWTEQHQCKQEPGNLNDQIHELLVKTSDSVEKVLLCKSLSSLLKTDNSITVDHLRTELDNTNVQLQCMENSVKEMRAECHRQVERQPSFLFTDEEVEGLLSIFIFDLQALGENECFVDSVFDFDCKSPKQHFMVVTKGKKESIGSISSQSVQLESTKETPREVQEDLTAEHVDLETAGKAVSNLTACLQEKDRALEGTSEEIKKLHSQLGSRMQELQHLKNEEGHLHDVQSETLKLQLLEKERIIEIFQKQIDNMTQTVGQHGRTAGAMEAEKSQLVKERSDWELKAEELKTRITGYGSLTQVSIFRKKSLWIGNLILFVRRQLSVAEDEKEASICKMEARPSELELEKFKLIDTSERLHALNDMKREKDQLVNELQGGRSELAGFAEGFEDLKRDYQDKVKEMENTANRLKMQLKSAQVELEQMKTALKTVEGSDGHELTLSFKTMKVAVGMQKQITAKRGQIDALQSKIKFSEEAMKNTAKEKHYLREESSKLSQELSCVTAENTKVAVELEILRSRDKRLKEKTPKVETALDELRFLLLTYLTLQARFYVFCAFYPPVQASEQFAECRCIFHCQQQEAMCFRLQHTRDVKMPSTPGILKKEPFQDLKRILQELTSSDNDIASVVLGKNDRNGGRKPPSATLRNTVNGASRGCAVSSAYDRILARAPQPTESSENIPRSLQNKLESLQNLVESLQIKNPSYTINYQNSGEEDRESNGKGAKAIKVKMLIHQ